MPDKKIAKKFFKVLNETIESNKEPFHFRKFSLFGLHSLLDNTDFCIDN